MDEQNKKKIEIYLMKTFCLLEKKNLLQSIYDEEDLHELHKDVT